MENKGKLVVISGFSGAGKGTLMKALMKEYGDSYALSVSATTRNPRPGEMDGVDYFFVTKDKFEQMIAEDALIEYAPVSYTHLDVYKRQGDYCSSYQNNSAGYCGYGKLYSRLLC